MVQNLFTEIAAVDAEGVDTMERIHALGGHMLLETHHNQVVARDGSVDNKDLKLLVIRIVGISTFALMLATAGNSDQQSQCQQPQQIFILHILYH